MSLGKHLEGCTVDKKGRTLHDVYMLYVEAHEACRDEDLSMSKILSNIEKRDKLQRRFIAFIVKILVNAGIYYDGIGGVFPSDVRVSWYVHKRSKYYSHNVLEICLKHYNKKREKKYYSLTYWGNDFNVFDRRVKILNRDKREYVYHKIMAYLPKEFENFLSSHLPCTC